MPSQPRWHTPADGPAAEFVNHVGSQLPPPTGNRKVIGDLYFKIPLFSEVRIRFEFLIIKQKNTDFLFE